MCPFRLFCVALTAADVRMSTKPGKKADSHLRPTQLNSIFDTENSRGRMYKALDKCPSLSRFLLITHSFLTCLPTSRERSVLREVIQDVNAELIIARMLFKASVLLAAMLATMVKAAPQAAQAPFSINLGNDGLDNVAWVHGESQCSRIVIGPVWLPGES